MKKLIVTLALLFAPIQMQAMPGFYEPWGKDSELCKKSGDTVLKDTTKASLAAKLAEQVILFHQNVISPVDGPRSHFRPTSSRYMLLAIRKYGFIKGFVKGCDRLLRENDSEWVYRTIEVDGKLYKWDPP